METNSFCIDHIDQYFVQEPENETILDNVFGWNKLASREVTMESNIHTGYQYPATMRYYLSNIADPDINQNLTILHKNNIPISVVARMNTLQEKRLAKAIGHNEITNGVSGWCKEGLYVIDYYNLDNAVGKGHKDAIRYILESDKIYKDNKELSTKIKDYVANKAEEKVQTSRYFKYPDIKIRVVSFIPKEKIVEYLNVQVRDLDIVVNLGELNPELEYPKPSTKISERMKIDLTPKHFVRYEVINNEIDDFPNFVYTVTGNTVIKIPVVKDPLKKTGCYVSRYINGICNSNEFSKLEDIETQFGIYKTYLDAKFMGDPNKQIEMNKIQLEGDKVNVGYKELELRKYKIRNERFLSTMELDRKREEWLYQLSKMNIDATAMKTKLLMEYKILEAKYMQEFNKAGKMDLSTYFTIALNCLKMLK